MVEPKHHSIKKEQIIFQESSKHPIFLDPIPLNFQGSESIPIPSPSSCDLEDLKGNLKFAPHLGSENTQSSMSQGSQIHQAVPLNKILKFQAATNHAFRVVCRRSTRRGTTGDATQSDLTCMQ